MKNEQRYTPKYWVLHDKRTDDVFIETLDKSGDGCAAKASKIKPNWRQNDNLAIELIQINFANAVLPWLKVGSEEPEGRCVAYSENDDPAMKYRIIPAHLFKQAARDATYFLNLTPPVEEG